jgi:hypothetical protein
MDSIYAETKKYIHNIMEQVIFINQYDLDQWIDDTFTQNSFQIECKQKYDLDIVNYVAEYNQYHYSITGIDFPICMDTVWNMYIHIVAKIELGDYFEKMDLFYP